MKHDSAIHRTKDSLTAAELQILEGQILPTARRWLREYPGLAMHAIQTLSYWGEPLVDDRGKPYRVDA